MDPVDLLTEGQAAPAMQDRVGLRHVCRADLLTMDRADPRLACRVGRLTMDQAGRLTGDRAGHVLRDRADLAIQVPVVARNVRLFAAADTLGLATH